MFCFVVVTDRVRLGQCIFLVETPTFAICFTVVFSPMCVGDTYGLLAVEVCICATSINSCATRIYINNGMIEFVSYVL